MGTLLDGLYDHEGYAARRLPDGTLTGSWTAATAEFTAYVAACSCSTGDFSYTEWYGGDHPPTEAGEEAALAEWQREHARPLLAQRRVDDEAHADQVTEALRTAGLIDPWGDAPNVEAIISTWWDRDGPHDPDRVAAGALALDELAHYLARATQHASPSGPRLYRLVGEVRSALGRLDQVLDQLSGQAAALAADPTLYDDRNPAGPIPGDRVRLTYGDGSTVEGMWEWDPEPGGYGALVRRDDGSVHRHTSGQVTRDVIVPNASRRAAADTARELQGGLDAARLALGQVGAGLAQAHNASGHLGHNL